MTDPNATPEPGFCELVQALETAALANSHCPTAFYYDALSAAREALKLYHLNALRRVEAKWRRTARSASGAADFEKQVDEVLRLSRTINYSNDSAREKLDHARRNLLAVLHAQRDLIDLLRQEKDEACQ